MIKIVFFLLSLSCQADNQFTQFFSSFESLSADFKQQVFDEKDTPINTSFGDLLFKRPSLLRWHTKDPQEQILLLNKSNLWIIDTELEQASLKKIDDYSQMPLYWLLNRPNKIKNIPIFSHSKDDIDWYKTTQKETYFGFKDSTLHSISFKNELQQIVLVEFSKVKTNLEINPELFELNIGPEFDIIKTEQ